MIHEYLPGTIGEVLRGKNLQDPEGPLAVSRPHFPKELGHGPAVAPCFPEDVYHSPFIEAQFLGEGPSLTFPQKGSLIGSANLIFVLQPGVIRSPLRLCDWGFFPRDLRWRGHRKLEAL